MTLRLLNTLAVSLAFLSSPAAAPAQTDHGHSHAEIAQPKDFADCVAQIRTLHARIGKSIAAKDLGPAHEDADALGQYAKLLGRIALKDASVPRDQVKAINVAGKDLARAAEDLHNAAFDKDTAKSNALYASLDPLISRLSGATPQIYVCDMHCEGCKTYTAPGTCTVCKMPFRKIEEVPFAVRVSTAGTVTPGSPAALAIKLLDPSGCDVKELSVVHEELLHFMVVSNDLSFYAHEHPRRLADGSFVLDTLSFPAPGKYTVFADFTPTGKGNQVATAAITVPGAPPSETLKLVENYDSILKEGDYEFRVRCNGKKFFAGEDSFIRIGADLKGKPVADFQPWMGELGHLVIISADLKSYVHCHPMSASPSSDAHDHAHAGHDHASLAEKLGQVNFANGKPSDLVFHAVFPRPGLYRAFAQFKHQGRLLTIPFTIDAGRLEGTPETPTKKADHSGHNH